MQRPATIWIGSIALAAAALLSGCGGTAEPEQESTAPRPVTVEPAVRGAIDRLITADAILYPVNQSNVMPKISAPIQRVLVNRGDHVKAGQVIAELESRDLASAAEEIKQQYEQAQAGYQTTTGATVLEDRTKAQSDVQASQQSLDAAKRLYENRASLQREGALAQKLVDDAKVTMVQAQSTYDTAQRHLDALEQVSQRETVRGATAQMNAAKARYESANVQLSYAQIRSPINGVVADRPVYPGEMAAVGSPIASIVDLSQVVARANIPVNEASLIQVGRPARIAGPDGDVPAKVTVVSPAVNLNTTTVEVWVQADNPGEKLKPGGTVRVTIVAGTVQNAIVIPAAGLLNSAEGGQKVMVVSSDGTAHKKKISVGARQGERIQIVSGVNEGDQVVTSGGLGLEDGAKVAIEKPKPDEEEDAAADEKTGDDKTGDAKK